LKSYPKVKGYIKKHYPFLTNEDCEELAQDCFEQWARNPNRESVDLKYVVIDALRSHTNFSRANRTSRITFEELREPSDACFSGLSQHESNSDENRRNFIAFVQNNRSLGREEKVILILRHLWGFNEKEIGELYGVSESRACQKTKVAEKKLQKSVSREKLGESESKEPREIPQEVQAQSWLQRKTGKKLARLCGFERPRVGFGAFAQIQAKEWKGILFQAVR
jgi:RNA polymerase sigma factor (sigma-70 family)